MLSVNYCGYQRSNRDYDRIFRPQGSGDYLFLLFFSPMLVKRNKNVQQAEAGSCLLYTPGFPQDYKAVGRFQNSYIHFSTNEVFHQTYQIPTNQIFQPQSQEEINQIIRDIYTEYLRKSIFYEEKIQLLLRGLFITLGRERLQDPPLSFADESLYTNFEKLRIRMLSNCNQPWSVDKLCKEIRLEKSQFYSYYRKFFNTTPINELIQVRIDMARNLLTNQALQIQQIAQLCGFQNIYYFTRYFRKHCGISPGQYRKIKTGKML